MLTELARTAVRLANKFLLYELRAATTLTCNGGCGKLSGPDDNL